MKKRHRTNHHKFRGKHLSKRGIAGLLLAVLSLALGIGMVAVSFLHQGSSSVYLGSGGVLSMLLALTAFILAVGSLREENSYKGIPVAASLMSGLALCSWIGVYVLGFLAM